MLSMMDSRWIRKTDFTLLCSKVGAEGGMRLRRHPTLSDCIRSLHLVTEASLVFGSNREAVIRSCYQKLRVDSLFQA